MHQPDQKTLRAAVAPAPSARADGAGVPYDWTKRGRKPYINAPCIMFVFPLRCDTEDFHSLIE